MNLHHLSLALHLHAPGVLAGSLSQEVAANRWNQTLEEAGHADTYIMICMWVTEK